MDIEQQIKILKVVNAVLIVVLIIVAYFVVLKYQSLGHCATITGELIYLKEISDPENPEIGVYLKLTLEYPNYAEFGEEGNAGFLIITNTTTDVGLHLKNVSGNERDGFIVDVDDKNNNGVIDTGDVFHIYGRSLNGYDVMFCVSGISGNIHTHIP